MKKFLFILIAVICINTYSQDVDRTVLGQKEIYYLINHYPDTIEIDSEKTVYMEYDAGILSYIFYNNVCRSIVRVLPYRKDVYNGFITILDGKHYSVLDKNTVFAVYENGKTLSAVYYFSEVDYSENQEMLRHILKMNLYDRQY